MKFYEFNEFGYYALIGAESEEEAINFYKETVADIEEDDGDTVEITKQDAKKRLLTVCEEEDKAKAINDFNNYIIDSEPCLILIDGSLL